jgi:ribosomal protein S18 acetylase RimI-like enzyme
LTLARVIEIRPARPEEFDRIGRLTVDAYRLLEVDHLWGGYDTAILDTAARASGAEVLVAVADGRVIGAVTYVASSDSEWSEWTEPGEVQFRLLAVDAAARGRGVGERLVRACLDRAAASGQPVCIHTTRWMRAARRMYDRLGFVRAPERDVTYEQWNDPPVPDLPPEWVGEPFLAYLWITSAEN